MKKLASRLPLQQIIANVISTANEKVAADREAHSQKVRNLVAYEKSEHGHIPSPAEERAEHEKTASAGAGPDYIEKLASSVEAIVANFDSIEFPQKGVLQKAAEQSGSTQGAGKGPGALEVSQAKGGTQNYNMGKARNTEASTSKANNALHSARQGDAKSQIENDHDHAPGGGGVGPTAKYPPKGPLVAGPTAKHASVQELYQSSVGLSKEKIAAELRKSVMKKLAGEDVMKANIEAEASANPLAGMGQLETFDASKAAPNQAGDASGGGFGNQARRLIASNSAAIDATKRDAKGPVKSQLSEVLDEPALSSSTDPVLENNLQNTGNAGVKIAGVRAALEKVAQQGCTCETIDGECAFCRLSTKVAAATQSKKESVKTANAMMGYGGGGGAMPPSTPSMSGGGGGMMSMADAGAGADGCQCGNTGECRVCKLKAALAAARANGGGAGMPGMMPGGPVEKDSQGAAAPVGTY